MNRRPLLLLLMLLALAGSAGAVDSWFNASWHYRVKFNVGTTLDRSDWPFEQDVNFTQLLAQKGSTSPFDANSIRVMEYNPTGSKLYDVAYQFDAAPGFSASGNACGTLSFITNGTTPANTQRYYIVYFDTAANGPKAPVSFTTGLNSSFDGTYFNVNNSLLQYYGDNDQGDDTSGLYSVQNQNFVSIFDTDPTTRSAEFNEYTNGTSDFGFNFANTTSILYAGPVRVVIQQIGNETYYGGLAGTGAAVMVKTYEFYENTSWVRVTQNYTNIGAASITRSSYNATAEAFDALDGLGPSYGNTLNISSRPRGPGLLPNSAAWKSGSSMSTSPAQRITPFPTTFRTG